MGRPKKMRDETYAARIAVHSLVGAPVLNSELSAALPRMEDVARFKVSDSMVALTVEKAAAYVDLPVFRGERGVSDAWAQRLLDEMMRGNFNWDLVILASCRLNGTTYKVNGQHTSWARISLPSEASPTVREIVYEVPSEEQLRHVYKTYDQGRSRSEQQLMKVTLLGLPLDPEVQVGIAAKVAIGVRFLRFEDRRAYNRVRDDEMATIVGGMLPVFQAVCLFYQSIQRINRASMLRQPVVAAVVATFLQDVAAATEFWSDIADGTNLIKGEHRWLLNQYLTRANLSPTPRKRAEVTQIVTSEDMFRSCINIWNKWRRGEAITVVRPTGSRVPAL